jgi:uncharacterized membrane protein
MLIVPQDKVRRLDIESGHVTKFVVSGGVANLDERPDFRNIVPPPIVLPPDSSAP